jgi:hypothetical protein
MIVAFDEGLRIILQPGIEQALILEHTISLEDLQRLHQYLGPIGCTIDLPSVWRVRRS